MTGVWLAVAAVAGISAVLAAVARRGWLAVNLAGVAAVVTGAAMDGQRETAGALAGLWGATGLFLAGAWYANRQSRQSLRAGDAEQLAAWTAGFWVGVLAAVVAAVIAGSIR